MSYLRGITRLVKKQCIGITQKKERCKRTGMTTAPNFYCYQHPKAA